MSITDPISSVVAKPSKFPFLSCPAAALTPSIVIRRRRTCTRSGSRTSPAFACRRHSYSASLGFSAVVPCLVRRHAAEAGGKGVRWRAARGAAVAAAGRKRGRSGPRVPPGRRSRRVARADFKRLRRPRRGPWPPTSAEARSRSRPRPTSGVEPSESGGGGGGTAARDASPRAARWVRESCLLRVGRAVAAAATRHTRQSGGAVAARRGVTAGQLTQRWWLRGGCGGESRQ